MSRELSSDELKNLSFRRLRLKLLWAREGEYGPADIRNIFLILYETLERLEKLEAQSTRPRNLRKNPR